MCVTTLFLSSRLVWCFIPPQHFYLSEVLTVLLFATSFCAWMITPKDLSFLEKWNKDRVCFLLWPHYELMSVPALLRHCSHAAYSITIALHHEQQKCCSHLQCLIFFILQNSCWKMLIWIFSSCFNLLYLHPFLFMNICTFKEIAGLKVCEECFSCMNRNSCCALLIFIFFAINFKILSFVVAKQKEGCEVQVSSQSKRDKIIYKFISK